MTPIVGFAPGFDPTVPGVVTDCVNMLPSTNGMKAAGAGENVGNDAITGTCYGATTAIKIDGSARTFAGTATKLYEAISGTWVDKSRAGSYTATPTRWNFTQFGDVSIAVNKLDATQYSITGAFADLAGAPKAQICETSSGFVLLFDYHDGTNDYHDGWWCSGLYDYTAWTPSPSTQAANGRFIDSPGKVVAAKRLAGGVAVYKENALYVGQYVGPPVIWAWTQIAADTGAYCQDAVINVSGVHYFMGRNGVFMFDGSRPQPVGAQEVRDWLRKTINPSLTANIVSGYDNKNSIIYWFFPSNNSTSACDEALCFNTMTGRFGRMTKDVSSIIDYKRNDLTWSDYAAMTTDWASAGSVLGIWGSSVLLGSGIGLCFIGADGITYKFESPASVSSVTFGDIGDDVQLSTLQRVKPRFLTAPSSATMGNYYKRNSGDAFVYDKNTTINDGKFDVLRSDRWHRVSMTFIGECEITAINYQLKTNGTR